MSCPFHPCVNRRKKRKKNDVVSLSSLCEQKEKKKKKKKKGVSGSMSVDSVHLPLPFAFPCFNYNT